MWKDPNGQSYTPQRQRQRFALVAFYYSTEGDHWLHSDNWLDYDVSECDWYSSYDPNNSYSPWELETCDDDAMIVIFDLHSNNLGGSLTGMTRYYEQLRYLDLSHNNITGSPPQLRSSKLMEVFDISHNLMEGSFVASAGFVASDLRVANIGSNQLSGYLNPAFEFLPKLEIFNLTSNRFHQEIASQFQYTTRLTYLGLGDNFFTGTIPTELSGIAGLQTLDVSGNTQVRGTIPSELALLKALEYFYISGTEITGKIPFSFCERQDGHGLNIVADCSIVGCCL